MSTVFTFFFSCRNAVIRSQFIFSGKCPEAIFANWAKLGKFFLVTKKSQVYQFPASSLNPNFRAQPERNLHRAQNWLKVMALSLWGTTKGLGTGCRWQCSFFWWCSLLWVLWTVQDCLLDWSIEGYGSRHSLISVHCISPWGWCAWMCSPELLTQDCSAHGPKPSVPCGLKF